MSSSLVNEQAVRAALFQFYNCCLFTQLATILALRLLNSLKRDSHRSAEGTRSVGCFYNNIAGCVVNLEELFTSNGAILSEITPDVSRASIANTTKSAKGRM